MKKSVKIILFVIFMMLVALPVPAHAQGLSCDEFVAGGTYRLKEGEVLSDSLCLIAGSFVLEAGSTVERDVLLVGGSLRANGTINGDLIAAGGMVTLSKTTIIGDNLMILGAQVNGEEQATILGEVKNFTRGNIPFDLSGRFWFPDIRFYNTTWDYLSLPLRSLLWAAIAIVIVLLFPNTVKRVAQTTGVQPVQSGAVGCGSLFLAVIILIGFAVTIICSPISVVGAIALSLFWGLGIISLGTEIGRRIALQARSEWALAVWAGIGTFLVTLVLNGVEFAVPCLGTIIKLIGGAVGFGAVILTRIGSQPFPPSPVSQPISPQPAPKPESQPPELPPQQPASAPDEASTPPQPPSTPPVSVPTSPPAPE